MCVCVHTYAHAAAAVPGHRTRRVCNANNGGLSAPRLRASTPAGRWPAAERQHGKPAAGDAGLAGKKRYRVDRRREGRNGNRRGGGEGHHSGRATARASTQGRARAALCGRRSAESPKVPRPLARQKGPRKGGVSARGACPVSQLLAARFPPSLPSSIPPPPSLQSPVPSSQRENPQLSPAVPRRPGNSPLLLSTPPRRPAPALNPPYHHRRPAHHHRSPRPQWSTRQPLPQRRALSTTRALSPPSLSPPPRLRSWRDGRPPNRPWR